MLTNLHTWNTVEKCRIEHKACINDFSIEHLMSVSFMLGIDFTKCFYKSLRIFC